MPYQRPEPTAEEAERKRQREERIEKVRQEVVRVLGREKPTKGVKNANRFLKLLQDKPELQTAKEEVLAAEMGMSTRSIRRCVRFLEEMGKIHNRSIRHQFGNGGWNNERRIVVFPENE